ncbi:uncharacterized protein EURHEDRAFT_67450 [Aspergillus ruber CBS 135680]|uniref:Secreted protein n=1 Tax=Aspergillus ruber (strain CBS 135680) TaxID=1388766 RepID=A0A017SEG5_ASPRC|nr:uncharacterized protein EURHEDRAFT_67450 [Aspergillus ruber CBS 135680]EYE95161.1 hypothetical protein EURHEDRAFT_67450 [Aspergillus ruber CBS 135680]
MARADLLLLLRLLIWILFNRCIRWQYKTCFLSVQPYLAVVAFRSTHNVSVVLVNVQVNNFTIFISVLCENWRFSIMMLFISPQGQLAPRPGSSASCGTTP